jgi:hypothetical protein
MKDFTNRNGNSMEFNQHKLQADQRFGTAQVSCNGAIGCGQPWKLGATFPPGIPNG